MVRIGIMGSMQPLASALPGTIRRLLRQGEMSQGKLEFAWRAAAGPAIDRACTVRLANGTVEVHAADLAWRRELRHSQAMILRRLQDLLGPDVVKAVRVVARGGARA
jgi:predicted nucleic acid-binding Zn ribbon protein